MTIPQEQLDNYRKLARKAQATGTNDMYVAPFTAKAVLDDLAKAIPALIEALAEAEAELGQAVGVIEARNSELTAAVSERDAAIARAERAENVRQSLIDIAKAQQREKDKALSQVSAMREALEPFAEWAGHALATGSRRLSENEYPPISGMPNMGKLYAACAALTPKESAQ